MFATFGNAPCLIYSFIQNNTLAIVNLFFSHHSVMHYQEKKEDISLFILGRVLKKLTHIYQWNGITLERWIHSFSFFPFFVCVSSIQHREMESFTLSHHSHLLIGRINFVVVAVSVPVVRCFYVEKKKLFLWKRTNEQRRRKWIRRTRRTN